MIANLNFDDNWKEWNRHKLSKHEFRNWHGYVRKEGGFRDRLIIFDSPNAFFECYEKNLKSKSWPCQYSSRKFRTDWTYGSDYPSQAATWKALQDGQILEKYIKKVDEAKFELYRRFPELSDLNTVALSKR